MTIVLKLNKTDKVATNEVLKAAGIKARIKVLLNGIRIVIENNKHSSLIDILNEEGYCNSGKVFTENSFNQKEENYGEIFVHHKFKRA